MNPAAYSFTAITMLDALQIFEGPFIEGHISNSHARELHRHCIRSSAAKAVICGLGPCGFILIIQVATQMLGNSRTAAASGSLRASLRLPIRVALVLLAANSRRSRPIPLPHAAHEELALLAPWLCQGTKCTALAHLHLRRDIAHIIGQSLGMNGPVVQPNAVG